MRSDLLYHHHHHHHHHHHPPSPTTFRPNILEIGPSYINPLLCATRRRLAIFFLAATRQGSCGGDSRVNSENHHHLPPLLMNHDRNGCFIPSHMMESMEFLAGARKILPLCLRIGETLANVQVSPSFCCFFFPYLSRILHLSVYPLLAFFLFWLGYTRRELPCCWLR
jgi:hypothetical protein